VQRSMIHAGMCLAHQNRLRTSSPLPSVIYLIYAINGSSYHDTALKGVLMALLSGEQGVWLGHQGGRAGPVSWAFGCRPSQPGWPLPLGMASRCLPPPRSSPDTRHSPSVSHLSACAAISMFCLTAIRFTYTAYPTFHSSAGLFYAISTAASYHSKTRMWE